MTNWTGTVVAPAPKVEDLSSIAARQFWLAQAQPVAPSLAQRVVKKVRRLVGASKPPAPAPWPPLGRVERETIQITFSNAKAKRLLGWSPQIDFHQGVELTRAWLLAAAAPG